MTQCEQTYPDECEGKSGWVHVPEMDAKCEREQQGSRQMIRPGMSPRTTTCMYSDERIARTGKSQAWITGTGTDIHVMYMKTGDTTCSGSRPLQIFPSRCTVSCALPRAPTIYLPTHGYVGKVGTTRERVRRLTNMSTPKQSQGGMGATSHGIPLVDSNETCWPTACCVLLFQEGCVLRD